MDGRPAFHINIVNQVSPYCDCHGENDTAIIPDVGMFASFDPVALDVACADACNRMPVMPGSLLDETCAPAAPVTITTILRMFLPIQIALVYGAWGKNRFGHTQL